MYLLIKNLMITGNFNARRGRDVPTWNGTFSRYGFGKINANSELRLSLCSNYDIAVTDTMLKLKSICKGTWKHPGSSHWHGIIIY